MADYVPVKKQRTKGDGADTDKATTTWPPPRLCQRCKMQFDPRHPESVCIYHPEWYSGETAQRWLDPGKNEGGGQMHYFWTCCGQPHPDSKGCARGAHITYDDAA